MTFPGLAERKAASKQIGALIGQGMSVDDAKAQVNETLQKIAAQIDELTGEAKAVQRPSSLFYLPWKGVN